ncbi:MAG TPA: dihydroneopterin aldolase [Verrucomicrobiae bacterium]|jgi:dihydroneopterin aldolase|nr:dihydroneopterin aldolase [Verrucomicrobiae bacterium]
MDTIAIQDLAVLCRIGVPEAERAKPQRLLITVEMSGDFSKSCLTDDLAETINYYRVALRITDLCEKSSFKLIERLAHEIAQTIQNEFGAKQMTVEVKKFILSDARYVSFRLSRP